MDCCSRRPRPVCPQVARRSFGSCRKFLRVVPSGYRWNLHWYPHHHAAAWGIAMVDVARRRQLAAYLRSHRERLTPVDVGIIEGPRRRTPGLRREEVALLSGVSVTWYTWIEQARDIVVSRQVLDSIARALRLPPAERRHLF